MEVTDEGVGTGSELVVEGKLPSGGGRLGPKSSSSSELEEEELLSAASVGGGKAGPMTLRRLLASSLSLGREGPAAYLRFSGSILGVDGVSDWVECRGFVGQCGIARPACSLVPRKCKVNGWFCWRNGC